MNEEELYKLFHRIELDKSSDSCGFEFADGFASLALMFIIFSNTDNISTSYS